MSLLNYNWTFSSDAQGFAVSQSTPNISFGWYGGAGQPAGCIQFVTIVSAPTSTITVRSPVKTWEDLGVPPGATIMKVQLLAFDYYGNSTFADFAMRMLSFGVNINPAGDLFLHGSSYPINTWQHITGNPLRDVAAPYQASTTPVQFEIELIYTFRGAFADAFDFDNFALAITYTGGSAQGGSTMAERATILEGVQLAVETTPGTAVAAAKRLLCSQIQFDPKPKITKFRPMGSKVTTAVVAGKELSEGTLKGILAYNDIVYLLSSLLCNSATVNKPASTYLLTLGTQTTGTFTLTFNAQTTATIVFNPTASAIAAALELLSTVGIGNVFVQPTLVANQFLVTFCHALGTTTQALTGTFTALGTPANASVAATASTLAKRWFFNPAWNAPDAVKTFTVENGQYGVATLGRQIPYSVLTQLAFKIAANGDNVDLSGNLIGQAMVDPFTLTTAGITDVPPLPVNIKDIAVFAGDATSSMTRLSKCLALEFDLKARFQPVFTLDNTQPSFAGIVEKDADPTVKLTAEQDSQAQTFLARLRSAATQFLRVECQGSVIETGFPYRFALTCPIKLTQPDNADQDGVYSTAFDSTICYDTGFGGWLKIEVDNLLAAL